MLRSKLHPKMYAKITSLMIAGMLLLAACAPAQTSQPQPATAQPVVPTQPLPSATQPAPSPQPEPSATQEASGGSLPVTGAAVQKVENARFGQILADANGMTLYTFAIDTETESKCVQSDCVSFWPPVLVQGQPAGSPDLPGQLGTITRPDGTQQLTYNGRPLYTFKLDQNPGDANGDGINQYGGIWHVATASGEVPNTTGGSTAPTTPPPADDGGKYNYSY